MLQRLLVSPSLETRILSTLLPAPHYDIDCILLLIMMMPSLPGITLRRSSPNTYRGRTVSIQLDDESNGATMSKALEEDHYRFVKEEPLSASSLPQTSPPFTTDGAGSSWNYYNDAITTDECSSVIPTPPSPTTTPSIAEESNSPHRKPRLRAAVEHIVYHPIVRFFTCVGGGGGGGGGSSHFRSSSSFHQSTILRTKAPMAILHTMNNFPIKDDCKNLVVPH